MIEVRNYGFLVGKYPIDVDKPVTDQGFTISNMNLDRRIPHWILDWSCNKHNKTVKQQMTLGKRDDLQIDDLPERIHRQIEDAFEDFGYAVKAEDPTEIPGTIEGTMKIGGYPYIIGEGRITELNNKSMIDTRWAGIKKMKMGRLLQIIGAILAIGSILLMLAIYTYESLEVESCLTLIIMIVIGLVIAKYGSSYRKRGEVLAAVRYFASNIMIFRESGEVYKEEEEYHDEYRRRVSRRARTEMRIESNAGTINSFSPVPIDTEARLHPLVSRIRLSDWNDSPFNCYVRTDNKNEIITDFNEVWYRIDVNLEKHLRILRKKDIENKPSPAPTPHPTPIPVPVPSSTQQPIIEFEEDKPIPMARAVETQQPLMSICPYCGGDISFLPETPNFCPLCKKKLTR